MRPLRGGERALCTGRRRDRLLSSTERDEERIPLAIDLVATMPLERVSQQPSMQL
jgi:hypothetical protein